MNNGFVSKEIKAVTKIKLFRLKNQMLFFNFIAITIGVLAVFILSYRSIAPPTEEIERLTFRLALFFEPFGIMFIVFVRVETFVTSTSRKFLQISESSK